MDRIFSEPEKELIGSWIEAGAQIPGEEKMVIEKGLALDETLSDELRVMSDQPARHEHYSSLITHHSSLSYVLSSHRPQMAAAKI